jgi:hypothetical protein
LSPRLTLLLLALAVVRVPAVAVAVEFLGDGGAAANAPPEVVLLLGGVGERIGACCGCSIIIDDGDGWARWRSSAPST